MTEEKVAGHDFDLNGRCRLAKIDGTQCHIQWRSIADADERDVGQMDIAHFGALNPAEAHQIRAKKERERAAMDAAMTPIGARWG